MYKSYTWLKIKITCSCCISSDETNVIQFLSRIIIIQKQPLKNKAYFQINKFPCSRVVRTAVKDKCKLNTLFLSPKLHEKWDITFQ